MIRRVFEYDYVLAKWVCYIGGPGEAVIYTDNLTQMEEFLDALELRTYAAAGAAKRIDVKLRKQDHVGDFKEGRRVCGSENKPRCHARAHTQNH